MKENELSKLWYELEDEEKKAEVEYCKMFNATPEEVSLNEMVRFRSGYCMGRHYGYLAGAKENGVVWHDLRKDPNDLPKVGYIVFLSYYDKTTETGYVRLDEVFCKSADDVCTKEVIAWCEIPQFKE